MKYLKTFEENSNYEPKVGDYVIVNLNLDRKLYSNFIDFLANNVGRISHITNDGTVQADYEDVPKELERKFYKKSNSESYTTSTTSIWHVTKDNTKTPHQIRLATTEEIKEYELKKAQNKYNL